MVLFATSGLTYVLNMFSFIRRRSAVDLLFYSGRQTRAAYVQHKLRRMGETQGTCRVPEMLGRDDLMWDCTQLVSVSLVTSRDQRDPTGGALTGGDLSGDAPALCQLGTPSQKWTWGLQVTSVWGFVSAAQQQSPRLRGQQLLPKNPLRTTVSKGGCSGMCHCSLMPAGCEG